MMFYIETAFIAYTVTIIFWMSYKNLQDPIFVLSCNIYVEDKQGMWGIEDPVIFLLEKPTKAFSSFKRVS